MATHDIKLPSGQRPQFPDRCVGCERPQPGHLAKIAVTGSRSTLGWTTDAALLAATGETVQGTNTRVKLAVPCCPGCARALERRHFWKTVMLYASGILGAAACIAVILWASAHGFSSGMGAFFGIVVLLTLLALPVVYELKHPPAFTVTPLEGHVTYEFVSALCAEEFVRANDPAAVPAPATAATV